MVIAAPVRPEPSGDGSGFVCAGARRDYLGDARMTAHNHHSHGSHNHAQPARPDAAPAIRFEDVTLGYGRHPAVHHLHGTVSKGELLAVVGPNGAGKSTLLKGIAGALTPLSGHIGLGSAPTDGVQTGGLTTGRIAYLPQLAEIDRSFPMPVFDMVAMGLWNRTGLFGGIGSKNNERIRQALATVGLTGFEDRTIGTLSGGQLQRALFARLLLQDADLILLDEPFAAIDSKTAADLVMLVQRWHDEKRTIIAVLHDLDLVRTVFPRTLLIAREVVAWGETREALSAQNLLNARHMLEAHDPQAKPCARAAA
jgi:zinc/manganese transport system ATP-binding protein